MSETAAARVLAGLRSRGQRITPARRALVTVLADTRDHLSADEIVQRVTGLVPGVHRATVYRALSTLVDLGAVSHTHLPHAATVYHLTSADPPHAHLQCASCGGVTDVDATLLDPLGHRLRDDLGFRLAADHVALLGTCRSCLGR